MSEMITSFIGDMSTGFFIRQTVVICVLFVTGFFTVAVSYGKKAGLFEILISFPVGLSIYTLGSFWLITTGIPFNMAVITVLCLTVVIICAVILSRRAYWKELSVGYVLLTLIAVLCISVISTSGLLPVSVSNDSLYYYHMYPNALTHNGGLRMQFNVFLTDVGQASAILNTLPFVYGFDEGFGIQAFMNINTLLLVIFSLFEKCRERFDKKKAVIVTAILTAVLICSMPYIVMTEWVMSNGYFMCYMFICVLTVKRYENEAEPGNDGRIEGAFIMGLLFTMMALLRMEGCIAALILLLCFSSLKYPGKKLFTVFLIPILVSTVVYDIRIFLFMKIDAPYTFLTPLKAIIQLAAIAGISVYVIFIRDRIRNMADRYTGAAVITFLVLANAVLFLYDRILYIENAKAFIKNLSNQSGWGLFPMLITGVYVMWFIARSGKTGYNETYWDLCFAAYLLTAIAVSFARDDALRESIADSGNRVMLQVTLLAFFAASMRVISLISNDGTADDDNIKNITDQEENRNG